MISRGLFVGSASASLARDYSNCTCGEGYDLTDLNLTGVQGDLVKEIYATGKPVVLILVTGRPFSITWEKEHIPAILFQWYGGEREGEVIADVLFGKVNPSGSLCYSIPQSVGHLPIHYNRLPSDKGIYRSPGTINKPGRDYVFSTPEPLWPFGYGLSYTDFEYLSATTSKEDYACEDVIEVTIAIRNTGDYDGLEVPQVYVRDMVSSVVMPVQELKGFEKVLIKKGETKQVIIKIPVSELALYNKEMKKVVEPGAFELQIGRASDDIRIKKVITVERASEKYIPTLRDKEKKVSSTKNMTATPVVVKGTIRDVQANLLPQVTVKVGKEEVVTNSKGEYSIRAMSTDTLIVSGSKFKTEHISIEGRQVVNIRMLNR